MNKIAELEFAGKNLDERWSEIKEDFWGDLKKETLRAVKRVLETTMAVEVQDLIGAVRWKHSKNKPTYRNGKYYRDLLTSYGWITKLGVPSGSFLVMG